MPRFLHVANGTSTTRTIEAAGIPGAVSIWADPLYEGPVPGGLNDTDLLDVRARFLAGAPEPARGAAPVDPVNDLRQWRAVLERLDSYDELILWFEHDLFDQLNLIQLLTWVREGVAAIKPVSLVCIASYPGRPRFRGLGELTPRELAPLLDARLRVTESQYALAELAWRAFREPAPEALDDVRRRDTSALPYLAAALTRFLQEYPWTTDGLSRTERRLLELASSGPIALSNAFPQMHEGEDAYYITDLSLIALALNLSRTPPPLLELAPDTAGGGVLAGSVGVTEAGRSVLAGERDRLAAGGIDRWLGGVHLQDPERVWRWDEGRQRITRQ